MTTQTSFSGAMGWGALSKGGRGGPVHRVTSSADAGPGTLRTIIDSYRYPHIIEFDVDTVELDGNISIWNPYVTIDGESAGGVTITGGGLTISTHDIIARHERLRGPQASVTLRPWADCHDVILDHLSLSGGDDDMIDIWWNGSEDFDMYNITVQNCLVANADPSHPTAMLTGGTTDLIANPPVRGDLRAHHISIHGNYSAHAGHRSPLIKTPHTEVINNVVYDWGNRIGGTGYQAEADWIKNYWLPGPNSNTRRALVFEWILGGVAFPSSSIFIEGNLIGPGHDLTCLMHPEADNWHMLGTNEIAAGFEDTPVPLKHRRYTRLQAAPIPVIERDASRMVNDVVAGSGAWPSDAIDQQAIDDFQQA